MLRRYIFSVCLLWLSFGRITALDFIDSPAHSLALSGSDICSSHEWSGTDNAASLAEYTFFTLAGSYSNRYLISELGSYLFCATIPTPKGTFSPAITYFGSRVYNQLNLAIAYGLKLTSWLNAGIKLGYHRIRVEATLKTLSAVTGDIAITAKPAENIAIAAILVNPTQTSLNDRSGDRMRGNLQVGITYAETENFCLAGKLTWNHFDQINGSMGAEYALVKQFRLQAGVEFPEIICYSFGFEIDLENLGIAMSGNLHPQLGISSAVSLSYKLR
jgi:hypothetical protein